ncbi:SpaA isopeptide-forming pilin-related protein [Porcipelethomonas ammoniilytica]|uniref:MSCRAMM family protein n=1 Tax=Porcipelethomonas ammoniilytica TaxID=2981722 RepID=UPI000820F080|nr:SpaA isopeptide-forming pilin-related protein [Porcipelethomonas ammoniilytica]MCU6720517.1 SpaA isopeptide-forming pilin-related protein [Porcipelethomonas ammoniilytica]SCJ16190.1 Predicted outer membrane protein [uncultured Ruminococcus sp.]
MKYTATQLLVWEVIVGQRDMNFKRVSNGYTSVEKMLNNFRNDYAGQQVSNYYYDYETKIQKDKKSVSFAKISKESAKASAVKAGADGTYTFKDKNKQLKNFDVTVNNGSVVSKSGNSLKVKADDGKTAVVTLTQNNLSDSGEFTGFLTLTSNSKQTLAKLKAGKRKYYAAVKGLENGNLEIIKTSEDGIVANIEFTVTGNGKTYNVKTDSNGKIKIPNLTAGEYTVTEKVPVRYEKQKSQKVKVQAGKTASVSFSNTLKKGAIKINKQSEDDEVGNRTFEIKGNGKTYTINTNSNGIAVLSDIPVYDKDNNKITYTISEKNVPIKYVVPANQTATLTADATTDKTFKNVLKKFTAEVIKKDSEYDSAQGDGSLAGAVYGIYKGDELVDTYTTDEKGYFKTKEYVCGDNWTIREVSPSEGYLLDETVYSVGAEANNYTVEKNTVKMTVKEDVIKGKISIIKHSDDGTTQIETPEEGAEFEVYLKSAGSFEAAKESEKDHLVCDKNGFDETKLLPYGIYIVHQTKGWENTEWMKDFEVVISENEKNYFYLINDAVLTSLVKIVKKDAETGNIIPVSSIGFKVWDCQNECYVEQTINYPTQITIDTYYTDESGSLMMPSELVYGNYELHEVQTANGYVLDETPVPFAIDGQEEVITVEKFNTAQKGRISVQKTGDIFTRVNKASSAYTDEDGNLIENPTTYTPVFETGNLAGAVFQVIASEDIITADGTVRAKAGDVVAELITDENGYAETDLLYLGKYEVKEITAPNGYVLNSKSQFIELVYAGQEIEVRDTVNAAFVNDYQRVEISLEKILEQDETFGIGTNEEYKSVRFGLFAEEEITAANGSTIPANGLISEISLDENMKAVFSVKLPFAKYYVREIFTDEHYILGDEKYSFDFKYSEEAETVIIDCGEFENKLKRGTVKGLKLDENNEPLENAVFGLFKPDCTEFTEENALMTAKSDDKGCFCFADIPFGEFAVRVIKAPTGYILSDKVYQVNITEDGQTVEITAENKPITVEFSKRDTEGNELKGAKLQIVDEKGNVIEEWISDGTNHIVKKLKAGKYVLTETAAPDGYEIATDISFEVFEDGTVKAGNTETVAVSKDGNPLIVMVDEAEEKQITPQTGDNRSKLPGIILTGTGLSILVILILKSRKKNGGKDEK